MEYVIIAVAGVIAAWWFRNALKDVFDVLKIFGRFGTYLWRLVAPDRALELGTKNRSADVQQIIDAETNNDLPAYEKSVSAASSDLIAEYLHAGVGDLAVGYAESHPTEVRAKILHAAQLIESAKQTRGTAVADKTDRSALGDYADMNTQARNLLVAALEQPSEFQATISGLLLQSYRGTGDKSAAYLSHKATLQSAPDRLDVQINMLNLISERWLGSPGEVLEVADTISATAGHNPGALPAAHIEHWMGLDGTASKGYFRQPDLLGRLEAAYNELPKRVPAGLWVPAHQQALALNAFALCFALGENAPLAKAAFTQIGDDYTPFPWLYLDSVPQKAFLKARDASS